MSLNQFFSQASVSAAVARTSAPARPPGTGAPAPAAHAVPRPEVANREAAAEPAVAVVEARDSVWEGSAALQAAYSHFIVDKETNQVRVQIRDANTNEVLREIPPEELTRIAAAVRAYQNAAQARRIQSKAHSDRLG